MDAHDMRSRALLALVMADQNAVTKLTANYQGSPEGYVENWLTQQGHEAEKAKLLAPHLRSALESMTPSGAMREASRERRGPPRTE